ncbi:DinB family protein [Salinimicrobium terrae]|uniref:DinB family protein n=1 Tax=Salinimicrobium terrae TaxID=470866 RepID=UPI0003F7B362|nr:DinB family protein [Salinimicrobium terrae]
MKKILLIFTTLVFFFFSKTEAEINRCTTGKEILEKDDRELLLNYFQQTNDDLQNQVGGLTANQMQYKSSEEAWSVSQVLEHIILTEEMIFGMVKEQMQKPANPERRPEITLSDDDLKMAIIDRSHKAKAPVELEGKGAYTNPERALEDLALQRKLMLDYIRDMPVEELRNRINDSPLGPIDAYQSFVFIAGHTSRHTLQIEELMASEDFPEN